jgi:hypothetical protein
MGDEFPSFLYVRVHTTVRICNRFPYVMYSSSIRFVFGVLPCINSVVLWHIYITRNRLETTQGVPIYFLIGFTVDLAWICFPSKQLHLQKDSLSSHLTHPKRHPQCSLDEEMTVALESAVAQRLPQSHFIR